MGAFIALFHVFFGDFLVGERNGQDERVIYKLSELLTTVRPVCYAGVSSAYFVSLPGVAVKNGLVWVFFGLTGIVGFGVGFLIQRAITVVILKVLKPDLLFVRPERNPTGSLASSNLELGENRSGDADFRA